MESHNVLFAFALTLFAGLATGVGSVIAFFAKTTNTRFLSVSLGFSAREYGKAHLSIYGVIIGMIVMAISLLLFA